MKTQNMYRLIEPISGQYQDFSTEAEAIECWLDCDYSCELELLTICE